MKKAEVTSLAAMKMRTPVVLKSLNAQIDEPDVGKAGSDQQTREASRIAEMAAVDVEPAAFLVGEEGFDMSAFVVKLRRQPRIRDVGLKRWIKTRFLARYRRYASLMVLPLFERWLLLPGVYRSWRIQLLSRS